MTTTALRDVRRPKGSTGARHRDALLLADLVARARLAGDRPWVELRAGRHESCWGLRSWILDGRRGLDVTGFEFKVRRITHVGGRGHGHSQLLVRYAA